MRDSRGLRSSIQIFLIVLTLIGLNPRISLAQKKKLDLDDLMIKGELHSDDRILILARERNEMKQNLRYRKDYRHEMQQEIDQLLLPGTHRKFAK